MTTSHSFQRSKAILLIALLYLFTPLAQADDDDYPMMGPMGMGAGPMGMMGMGQMGMGQMGMMGMYSPFHMLDLSDAQRKALRDIQRKTRSEHLALQDQIMELSDQLYSLYNADRPDAGKIGEVYQQIFKVRRQMIELHIKARNQQYDKLSKEQQDRLKDMRAGWMMPYGQGQNYRGMMPHMMR